MVSGSDHIFDGVITVCDKKNVHAGESTTTSQYKFSNPCKPLISLCNGIYCLRLAKIVNMFDRMLFPDKFGIKSRWAYVERSEQKGVCATVHAEYTNKKHYQTLPGYLVAVCGYEKISELYFWAHNAPKFFNSRKLWTAPTPLYTRNDEVTNNANRV